MRMEPTTTHERYKTYFKRCIVKLCIENFLMITAIETDGSWSSKTNMCNASYNWEAEGMVMRNPRSVLFVSSPMLLLRYTSLVVILCF